jgi:hypothetical protein
MRPTRRQVPLCASRAGMCTVRSGTFDTAVLVGGQSICEDEIWVMLDRGEGGLSSCPFVPMDGSWCFSGSGTATAP